TDFLTTVNGKAACHLTGRACHNKITKLLCQGSGIFGVSQRMQVFSFARDKILKTSQRVAEENLDPTGFADIHDDLQTVH
ncbi:Hypothetical protein FKW44_002228, partial [Caligus rogercresseyi]